MPARKLPPNHELVKMYRSGMSHQEMADTISEQIGEPVTRVAITLALSRIGEEPRQARYAKRIPWRVNSRHRNEGAVRMLRLLGRRDVGGQLPEVEAKRLDDWLQWLKDSDAVVAYCPERAQGFVYVPSDEPEDEFPIRPRELDPAEFYPPEV